MMIQDIFTYVVIHLFGFNKTMLWVGTILAIICTTIRALNLSIIRQRNIYLLSCVAYIIFIYHEQMVVLNCFYLFMGLIGAWRWS